uniref:Suf domain-containing protein n=1 Tax=Echinostoma caproni TaxID=27848 RepID=A0A183B253_9TREM
LFAAACKFGPLFLTNFIIKLRTSEEHQVNAIKDKLDKDPGSVELCLQYGQLLSESNQYDRLTSHCMECINEGRHIDSPEWFQFYARMVKNHSGALSENALCFDVIADMFLLRINICTSPEDFYNLLESLHGKIHRLPADKFVRFHKESESWLSFYSAVYIQRFFSVESKVVLDVLCENYRRSVELHKSIQSAIREPFSHLVWSFIDVHQAENTVQAWCLMNTLRQDGENEKLRKSSWSDLMDMLPSKFKSASKEGKDCIQMNPSLVVSMNCADFWLDCRDALLESQNNLKLVLWVCCHLTALDSGEDDVALSNQRLDFIFKSQQSDHSVMATTSDCLGKPISLLSSCAIPTVSQQQWWEIANDLVNRNAIQLANSSKSARQSTFLQCGLNQLRLFARPARCFGNQTHVLPPALSFRVADALTRLAEGFISSDIRLPVLEWAGGFWRYALHQCTFGPPPPNATLVAQNRQLPACSGSSSLFTENRVSSPCSPLRSVSLTPGPPTVNHSLFSLPGANNWWLGLTRSSHQPVSHVISHWCNLGLHFCANRLTRVFETNGNQLTSDEKCELRSLLRILEQSKVNVDRGVYLTVGQLLLRHARGSESTTKNLPSDPLDDALLLSGDRDPLADLGRAKRYLDLATIAPISCEDSEVHQIRHKSKSPTSPMCSSTKKSDQIEQATPESYEGPQKGARSTPKNPLGLCAHTDERQEFLMASFMNNWQSLINSLCCQLTEAKVEMSRSRQLNEQLSTQLQETSKQLSETMNKFVEFKAQMNVMTKVNNSGDVASMTSIHDAIATPIRELSHAIAELRRWLPEGMAAAATAAVNAHMAVSNQPILPPAAAAMARTGPLLNNADAAALMHLYGSNLPLPPTYLNSINPIPLQQLPGHWRMSATAAAPATLQPKTIPPGEVRPVQKPGFPSSSVPWADVPQSGIRFGDPNTIRLDYPLPSGPGKSGDPNFPTANYGEFL